MSKLYRPPWAAQNEIRCHKMSETIDQYHNKDPLGLRARGVVHRCPCTWFVDAVVGFGHPPACPDPQMSFQALAFVLPPLPKFILLGSLLGRLSGSRPAFSIELRK